MKLNLFSKTIKNKTYNKTQLSRILFTTSKTSGIAHTVSVDLVAVSIWKGSHRSQRILGQVKLASMRQNKVWIYR